MKKSNFKLSKDERSIAHEIIEEEKKERKASLIKSCFLFPAAAGLTGVAVNMFGGDVETSAIVGAGVAGAVPLLATMVGTTVTAAVGAERGKSLSLKVAALGLASTVLLSSMGAGMGAGTHMATDFAKEKLPKMELTVKRAMPKLETFVKENWPNPDEIKKLLEK